MWIRGFVMSQSIPTINYVNLFDQDYVAQGLGAEAMVVSNPYNDPAGIRYDYGEAKTGGSTEVLQLGDDAFMLFSEMNQRARFTQKHVVGHEVWIHVQYRLEGESNETFDDLHDINATGHSCVIVRHQADTSTIRTSDNTERSRSACLYFRPSMLESLFNIRTSDLPAHAQWISSSAQSELDWLNKPLPSSAVIAANDIFSCDLQGGSRQLYMRAKSMELISLTINELQRTAGTDLQMKLSLRDIDCLNKVREILHAEVNKQHSLQDLAKRVGINRTKLAIGFKSIYGETVAAYWRDLKLAKARQLLEEDGVTVIEASNAVGYAEPSCLSRAFMVKYGIQPIECRNKGRRT